MGRHTGANAYGEAIYDDIDGGIHAIDVDGTNRRDIIPSGGITSGKQLVLDSRSNLHWGDREGFALTPARTDGSGLCDLIKDDTTQEERDWIAGVPIDETNGYIN